MGSTVTDMTRIEAPWGYDMWTHTEVVPRPPPIVWRWTIGPVTAKTQQPGPSGPPHLPSYESEFTMQLTADQQVALHISGEDRYGNPVPISGDVVWQSSDETIVQVTSSSPEQAVAVAVGPVGTAAVTCTNDANRDGTGDFMGSLAIDVVAGQIAEIAIQADEPTAKPPA